MNYIHFFSGELQCLIMPSANKNWNCNNNNDPNVNQTCSSTNQSSSSAISTAQRSSSPKVTLACRSRSSAARITLSHPCVSDTQTVGATTIFPHLFLGSQQDVIDEVHQDLIFYIIFASMRKIFGLKFLTTSEIQIFHFIY